MLKPLTAEGRFECGLDAIVAVLGEAHPAALGVAVQDEPGYLPIPEVWVHADDVGTMEEHAEALNRAEGLEPQAAALIVISTLRGARR